MNKKTDIYLRVIAGAFVVIPEKAQEPLTGRILIKIQTDGGGEDLVGLHFADMPAIDSCLRALERIRAELQSGEKLHPLLKNPAAGDTH